MTAVAVSALSVLVSVQHVTCVSPRTTSSKPMVQPSRKQLHCQMCARTKEVGFEGCLLFVKSTKVSFAVVGEPMFNFPVRVFMRASLLDQILQTPNTLASDGRGEAKAVYNLSSIAVPSV